MNTQEPDLGSSYHRWGAQIHLASAEAGTKRIVELESEVNRLRRHVELLKEELDSVPVAKIRRLYDDAEDNQADIGHWLSWAEFGAHWQPADEPCPDCGADALAVAAYPDGTIEQWLCDECGYVATTLDAMVPPAMGEVLP